MFNNVCQSLIQDCKPTPIFHVPVALQLWMLYFFPFVLSLIIQKHAILYGISNVKHLAFFCSNEYVLWRPVINKIQDRINPFENYLLRKL